MKKKGMRIAFIHNKAMPYRIPQFKRISKIYDISFLFFDEEKERMMEIKEKIWDRQCESVNKLNIVWKLLKGRYDILIIDDIVFLESYLCFLYGILSRKKIVLWSSVWDWPKSLKWRLFFERSSSYMVKSCNSCVVPGIKSYEYFRSKGARNIFISSNPSNFKPTSKEKTNEIIKKYDIQEKIVIFFFGRIVEIKGLDYLIKAMYNFKGREDLVLIIGESRVHSINYKEKIVKLSNDLNLENIYFLDIKEEEKGKYFQLADIFVLPSVFLHGNAEAYGLVIVEAMMSGKPIVTTTAVAAAYDLVKDGVNGFIVQDKDPHALYSAINKLVSNPVLREKMGMNSKKICEKNVSYERMVKAFISAIETAKKS